jgi:hypothetical protein
MFLASLLAVSAATVNYVLGANIYPSLGGNWFLAGMATVITMSVFVGGPICVYDTLTTDFERRRFARRTAKSGLYFGFAWLGLLGVVCGLDNFNVVTLTAHPFHGDQRYLNRLFPALENAALCLMVIAQILGESLGAVALEIRTMRKKDQFRKFTNEPNPCYADLKIRTAATREIALKLALQQEWLTQQEALLDKGRDVFATMCTAWLEAQRRQQRGACFSCLATGVRTMFKFVMALMLCMVLSGVARARTFVLAIPANLSPEFTDAAEDVVAGVVAELQANDTFVAIDASHLTIIARVTAPANLGGDAKARARVFGEAEGKINDLIDEPDKTAALDDLDIPVLLRELGRNVLPELPDKDVHILLIGSVIWQSKDTNWTFREYVPSDGFLVKPVGDFGVTGQETILSGSLTSICYTNKIGSFAWEGFRREILAFWGKSIAGHGGKVGGLQPFAPDCAARLFSAVEDKTPYVINRGEDVFLRKMHWKTVDVR